MTEIVSHDARGRLELRSGFDRLLLVAAAPNAVRVIQTRRDPQAVSSLLCTGMVRWHDAGHELELSAREGSWPGMPAVRILRFVLVNSKSGLGTDAGTRWIRELHWHCDADASRTLIQ